jgi:hypothetical protein
MEDGMRRLVGLAMLALVGCAGKGDSGGFGGGGSGGGSGSGDDGGTETEIDAPEILNVTATFTQYTSWVIEFLVDYEYAEDITGGTVEVSVQEGQGEVEYFDLAVGGTYAKLNDGLIQFAVEGVDRSKRYHYDLSLVGPDDGEASEPWDGTLEPAI